MEKPKNDKVNKARRNTEARREQNRVASRNYREKRKQKLALLNQILDGEEAQLDQEHQADTSYLTAIDESLPVAGTSEGPREAITASTNEVSFGDIWGDLPDSSNIGFEQTPFLDRMKTPDLPISQGLEFDSFLTWDPASSTQSLLGDVTGPAEGNQSLQRTTLPNNSYFDLLKGVDSLSFHQKRALIRHIQRETQDSSAASPVPPRSMTPTFPSTGELEIMHQRGLRLEAQHFAQALHRTASRRGPAPMPSQYVLQGGFFGALMANCYAIGMGSVDALLVEDGWSVFSLAPDLGYHPSQLPLVRARFQDMTPDLRPVDMQLTFAHHPYLDVIPFRSFRENALKALDQDPPLLDEDELCRDLLDGGMLCWGGQQKALSLDAAVPWDARSWEPKVWFLRKYKHLVGGWDDEMWKKTRWWHRVRGERIQEIS